MLQIQVIFQIRIPSLPGNLLIEPSSKKADLISTFPILSDI